MANNDPLTNSEVIGLEDLQSEFLTLRVGEEIPRLEITRIRRLNNPARQDNLPGVDFKYLIETQDKKLLTVNTWTLWRKIASALRQVNKIQTTLEIKHLGIDDYSVRVI